MVDSKNCGKLFLIIILAVFLLCEVQAKKSRVPISEAEIRQKKNDCYEDIESIDIGVFLILGAGVGLWGQQCKSSTIAKENCALRCVSPACYELIYESDPLEEGEKDFTRSSEYKYCMHRASLGESLDGIRGTFDV
ncbi:hypothetical protein CASFOL_033764 [Castilleja foliolosa]|uniref:Uncharacterized protein n=1 Tax=Castilleja foliolosa TaxID=1961234 RepID=A0ABD3BYR7_9LAMI